MVYLHFYETDPEFHEVYDGPDYNEPWVSLTQQPDRVDYNKVSEYTVTITYENRAGTGTTFDEDYSGPEGEPISFSVASAPSAWDSEHQFLGWATVEWPTYEQVQQAGFLKQGGDRFSVSEDTTLYAVYSTTFQGLINEGYVDCNVTLKGINGSRVTLSTDGFIHGMFVKPNGYPKELVTDFMDVFNNSAGYLVSTGSSLNESTDGVVGSGDSQNIFVFPHTLYFGGRNKAVWDGTEHWLTDDEWYDLYNDVPLKQFACSYQFECLDWEDKGSVTIKYGDNYVSGLKNFVAIRAFGNKMPQTLNVVLLKGTGLQIMQQMFGNEALGQGCSSEIINLSGVTTSGTVTRVTPTLASRKGTTALQATFEGCTKFKEVHGLGMSGISGVTYMFDGCTALEELPAADFPTDWTPCALTQTFCNCSSLETIDPELIVSGTADVTNAFRSCNNLTYVHLKGINAAMNSSTTGSTVYPANTAYTWDLHYTKLTQACADYMITNLTPCDPTAQGFVMKGINFPTTVTLTSAQITTLRSNGWIPYINGVEQQ